MAAFRSPLFILGLAAAPVVVQCGTRSMLAPWIGGACKPAIVTTCGPRSMLAFWAGGACAGPATPSVSHTTPQGRENRHTAADTLPEFLAEREKRMQADEAEFFELLTLIAFTTCQD